MVIKLIKSERQYKNWLKGKEMQGGYVYPRSYPCYLQELGTRNGFNISRFWYEDEFIQRAEILRETRVKMSLRALQRKMEKADGQEKRRRK